MTSNPMLAPKVIENVARQATKPMTISGTINKTIVLLLTVILTSLYTWNLCATGFSDKAMLLTWIGIIAGIIFAILYLEVVWIGIKQLHITQSLP